MTKFHAIALQSVSLTAIAAIALLTAVPASAVPVFQDYNLDFSSPTQSFWGPGKSAASFNYNKVILGNTNFGVRFQTGASTGTVSSNYNGAVSVSYENDIAAPGLVPLTVGYVGDTNGGSFATAFGAFAKAMAYFPLIGGVTITNPNYFLNTGQLITPSPADILAGTDSFTPASTAIGPGYPGGTAQAGIDYDIVQNSTLKINALNGIAMATNQTSGDTRTAAFSLGSTDDILLNLNEPGIWDVHLANLGLSNLFSTSFNLAFVPFVQYILGFNCGDPASNSDNGFGCVADARLDKTIASFKFFSNTPFALDLTSDDTIPDFQITVQAPTSPASVPEPNSLAVLAAGIAAFSLVRRRYAGKPANRSAKDSSPSKKGSSTSS